jgi:hypothetical protein
MSTVSKVQAFYTAVACYLAACGAKLGRVTAAYREAYPERAPMADDIASECLRYLAMKAAHGGLSDKLGMHNGPVDDYWHMLITYTVTYHELCETCFGGYIHHEPAFGSPVSPEAFGERLAYTRETYTAAYADTGPFYASTYA